MIKKHFKKIFNWDSQTLIGSSEPAIKILQTPLFLSLQIIIILDIISEIHWTLNITKLSFFPLSATLVCFSRPLYNDAYCVLKKYLQLSDDFSSYRSCLLAAGCCGVKKYPKLIQVAKYFQLLLQIKQVSLTMSKHIRNVFMEKRLVFFFSCHLMAFGYNVLLHYCPLLDRVCHVLLLNKFIWQFIEH